MGNLNPENNPLDGILSDIDMRGFGDPGVTSRIVNLEQGTPEQIARLDILREVAKPYEDYFNGLARDFVESKTLQPGVTAKQGVDQYWKPRFSFTLREEGDSYPTYTKADITFQRHRRGRFPRWNYDWTCLGYEKGDDTFSSKRDTLAFDLEGKIRDIYLGNSEGNHGLASLFTGTVNENIVARNFGIALGEPSHRWVSADLVDLVNNKTSHAAFVMGIDGNFWRVRGMGNLLVMDFEQLTEDMKLALNRFHQLPFDNGS